MTGYVSLAEATHIIEQYCPPGDEQRAVWEAASAEQKEVFLRRALLEIESLQLAGERAQEGQKLSFPRLGEERVSEAVKTAQSVEALELCAPGRDSRNYEAVNGAVRQYSIGDLSESFKAAAGVILRSETARALLEKYTGGSYETR